MVRARSISASDGICDAGADDTALEGKASFHADVSSEEEGTAANFALIAPDGRAGTDDFVLAAFGVDGGVLDEISAAGEDGFDFGEETGRVDDGEGTASMEPVTSPMRS